MTYAPLGVPQDFNAVHDELRRIASSFRNLANYRRFVPVWSGTLGNGTLEGWILQPAPDWRVVSVTITWGSTTSHAAADQSIQLPAELSRPAVGNWIGSAHARDGSTRYHGSASIFDGDDFIICNSDNTAANWDNNDPFTWGSGDTLYLTIGYAIALGRA